MNHKKILNFKNIKPSNKPLIEIRKKQKKKLKNIYLECNNCNYNLMDKTKEGEFEGRKTITYECSLCQNSVILCCRKTNKVRKK